MNLLFLLGGLSLLVLGAEALVRGAVALARRLRLSPLLIGLVVVGFGTSTPELVVSVGAALHGSPGIAVGNVVGSNICNVLLILGAAAVISPIRTRPSAVIRDAAFGLGAAGAVIAFALGFVTLDRPHGLVLIALLAAAIAYTYRRERRHHSAARALHAEEAEQIKPLPKELGIALLLTASGLAMLVIGADFFVDGAVAVARRAGISETVIGLTLVALGTSLPELATSAVAALRRHSDIALGNVLGSNLFNLLGILGTTALVTPIAVPTAIVRFDIWVMLAAMALPLPAVLRTGTLGRIEGGVFLALYAAYIGWLYAANGA